MESLLPGKYCANCGLSMPSNAENMCPQCGHDQRAPIPKKMTTAMDMACAVISYASSISIGDEAKEYLDDLVKQYGRNLNQLHKNKLLNVFLLSNLAITSIIYIAHCAKDSKYGEIIECFKTALDDYLLHAYGKEDFQEVRDSLTSLLKDYHEAFTEKNFLQSVSKILQNRAESVILGVSLPGAKYTIPSIHAYTKYLVHISSFIPPLQATLNKWDIR